MRGNVCAACGGKATYLTTIRDASGVNVVCESCAVAFYRAEGVVSEAATPGSLALWVREQDERADYA